VAANFPAGRSVLHFRLDGAPPRRRYRWIVVERRKEVDVSMTDPGHPVTLTVTTKLRTLVDLLLEEADIGEVLRQGLLVLQGDRQLARRFETLFDFEGGAGSFTGSEGHHQQIVGAGRG
jgi:SCP-2 sterol transfer family protein